MTTAALRHEFIVCTCTVFLILATAVSTPCESRGQSVLNGSGDASQSASTPVSSAPTLPAFPGAQGFGATSLGGRGPGGGVAPRIFAVTTLADQVYDPVLNRWVAAPGSLREAVEATGPRFVVFKIGGAIALRTQLEIRNPYITIAGQTAAAPGIALVRHGVKIATHDVVLRHLRIRLYVDEAAGDGLGNHSSDCVLMSKRDSDVQNPDTDAINNIIIDHCSLSWAIDETIDINDWVKDCTISWSIISEASYYGHAEGPQSNGLLGGHSTTTTCPPGLTRLSVHHCLFAHNYGRNPRLTKGSSVDFRNNVVYNYTRTAAQFVGAQRVNYVGNTLLRGLDTPLNQRARNAVEVSAPGSAEGTPRLYVKDNYGLLRTSSQQHEWDIGVFYTVPNDGTLCNPTSSQCMFTVRPETNNGLYYAFVPGVAPTITTQAAGAARDLVINNAGAILPVRDAVDGRLADELRYVVAARPFDQQTPGYDPYADPALRFSGPHDGAFARVWFFQPRLVASHYCTPRTYRLAPYEFPPQGQINLLRSLNCTFPNGFTLPQDAELILAIPSLFPWSLDERTIPDAVTVQQIYPTNVNPLGRLDTDGDHIPNSVEIQIGSNPYVADSLLDADGDGYLNIEEYLHLLG